MKNRAAICLGLSAIHFSTIHRKGNESFASNFRLCESPTFTEVMLQCRVNRRLRAMHAINCKHRLSAGPFPTHSFEVQWYAPRNTTNAPFVLIVLSLALEQSLIAGGWDLIIDRSATAGVSTLSFRKKKSAQRSAPQSSVFYERPRKTRGLQKIYIERCCGKTTLLAEPPLSYIEKNIPRA